MAQEQIKIKSLVFKLLNLFGPAISTVILYSSLKSIFPVVEFSVLIMASFLINIAVTIFCGFISALFTTISGILAISFYFLPPYFHFIPEKSEYMLMLLVMFLIHLLTSQLLVKSKDNASKALMAERKAEREEMVSSLLSSISHDIRTPLTSIAGAASTLVDYKEELPQVDRHRLYETIYEESKRLNRLVGNILQITKVESANLVIEKDLHSLEEIVGSTLERFESSLGTREININISEKVGLVPMDASLIEQVFSNLFENAIYYTPPETPLEIRAFITDGKLVQVEVLDRGPGIDRTDAQHIFEKFYRGANKKIFGSGLGLAICKGIVHAHQGEIGFKKRDGGGSIFYFSLPLSVEKKR